MRRAIAHGMALFRQHGGHTRRFQCVLGPLAAPDARTLFMGAYAAVHVLLPAFVKVLRSRVFFSNGSNVKG